jgi:hypothetical protein
MNLMMKLAARPILLDSSQAFAERHVVMRSAVTDHDIVAVEQADLRVMAGDPYEEAFNNRSHHWRVEQPSIESLRFPADLDCRR